MQNFLNNIAKTILIHKKGSKVDINNYVPISSELAVYSTSSFIIESLDIKRESPC